MKTNYCDVITINFIILRMNGLIDWSWWWVFSPIWIGLLILAILWALK